MKLEIKTLETCEARRVAARGEMNLALCTMVLMCWIMPDIKNGLQAALSLAALLCMAMYTGIKIYRWIKAEDEAKEYLLNVLKEMKKEAPDAVQGQSGEDPA